MEQRPEISEQKPDTLWHRLNGWLERITDAMNHSVRDAPRIRLLRNVVQAIQTRICTRLWWPEVGGRIQCFILSTRVLCQFTDPGGLEGLLGLDGKSWPRTWNRSTVDSWLLLRIDYLQLTPYGWTTYEEGEWLLWRGKRFSEIDRFLPTAARFSFRNRIAI